MSHRRFFAQNIFFLLSVRHSTQFNPYTRADQNTGGTLSESPMRSAMHEKSRVSSAISVCDD